MCVCVCGSPEGSPEGSEQEDEDDEGQKNWRIDGPEPDSWDEWNDDGGQMTPHASFPQLRDPSRALGSET